MPTPLFTRLLLSLGLLLSLAPSAAPAQTPGDAPAISGRTLSAEPFDLAALRGKVVLVLFWSTDCPVCLDKMPELRANAQGWRGKPFELVSVSFDRRERNWSAPWCPPPSVSRPCGPAIRPSNPAPPGPRTCQRPG